MKNLTVSLLDSSISHLSALPPLIHPPHEELPKPRVEVHDQNVDDVHRQEHCRLVPVNIIDEIKEAESTFTVDFESLRLSLRYLAETEDGYSRQLNQLYPVTMETDQVNY